MSTYAFSFAGLAFVFLVAIPAATLAAKLALMVMRRVRSFTAFGGNVSYGLIVAPALVPILWFMSGALHQSEPGAALAACLHSHPDTLGCVDALLLAVLLALVLGWGLGRHLLASLHPSVPPDRGRGHEPFGSLGVTFDAVVAGHPQLAAVRARLCVVSGTSPLLCTRGLLRPRVEIHASVAQRLAAPALESALLHELQHLHARDPLRFLVATASLALNPLAALLRGELATWRAAREAACDRAAVASGGDPLALADALVQAAGGASVGPAAGLGGTIAALRLRVRLLLGYAGRRPRCRCARPPGVLWAGLACALVLGLPHTSAAGLLDVLHWGIERAVAAGVR